MEALLQKSITSGEFVIETARGLAATDWRYQNAEDLFYFIEGYVEETDEGFMDEPNDPELYQRAISLLSQLKRPAQSEAGGTFV